MRQGKFLEQDLDELGHDSYREFIRSDRWRETKKKDYRETPALLLETRRRPFP